MPTQSGLMTEQEVYESIDRSIAQADRGELQDAFEALDEISAELEAGYAAMRAAQQQYRQTRATTSL